MITSRERVANALDRKPNDRTPYHFRAEPEVYEALKIAHGLSSDEEVRRWANSDVRDLGTIFAEVGYGGYTGFGWSDRLLPDGTQEDFWGVRRRRVEYQGGAYTEICHSPLKEATARGMESYDWPDPSQIFDFSDLPARVPIAEPGERVLDAHGGGEPVRSVLDGAKYGGVPGRPAFRA